MNPSDYKSVPGTGGSPAGTHPPAATPPGSAIPLGSQECPGCAVEKDRPNVKAPPRSHSCQKKPPVHQEVRVRYHDTLMNGHTQHGRGGCCGRENCDCQNKVNNAPVRPFVNINIPKKKGCGDSEENCEREQRWEQTQGDLIFPEVGSSIILPVCDPSAYKVGMCVYLLPDLGWLKISSIADRSISAMNEGHRDNVLPGSSILGPVAFVVGVCPKPDLDEGYITSLIQNQLTGELEESVDSLIPKEPCWTSDAFPLHSFGRLPLIAFDDETGKRCLGWQTIGAGDGCLMVLEAGGCDSLDYRIATLQPQIASVGDIFLGVREEPCGDKCLKPRLLQPTNLQGACEPGLRFLGYTTQEIVCPTGTRIQKYWREIDKLMLPATMFGENVLPEDQLTFVMARRRGDCCELVKVELAEGEVLVGGPNGTVTTAKPCEIFKETYLLDAEYTVNIPNTNQTPETLDLTTVTGYPECATHVLVRAAVFALAGTRRYITVNGVIVAETPAPYSDFRKEVQGTVWIPLNGNSILNYEINSDVANEGEFPYLKIMGFHCDTC